MNTMNSFHNNNKKVNVNPTYTPIDFVPNKIPWAAYIASSYDSVSNTISDSSGNNRAAAITTNLSYIYDPTFRQPILTGNTGSTILFPAGSLPVNYTLGSVTRYAPLGTNRRVLTSPNRNFTHPHFAGYNSLFFNNSGTSPFGVNYGPATIWCVAVSTNSVNVTTPQICSLNGRYIGNGRVGPNGNGYQLCINLSHNDSTGSNTVSPSDQSDFQFYALVIYDQALTAAEMTTLTTNLSRYVVV